MSKAGVLNLFSLQRKRPLQRLLFSATMAPLKLEKLSNLYQPKLFTTIVAEYEDTQISNTCVGKYRTPNELNEQYILCLVKLKPLILYEYIKIKQYTKTMVFTHSLNSAEKLCILLRNLFGTKWRIEVCSKLVMEKKQLIADFSSSKISIIICTDALARGIDIPGVQCVISYSTPKHLKTYIHRAGRTARAGSLGTVVTLLEDAQFGAFTSLVKQSGKENVKEVVVPTENLKPLLQKYEHALKQLKKSVLKEEEKYCKKRRKTKRAIQ